jgi:hypothetical protein
MKENNFSRIQNQKPAATSPPTAIAPSIPSETAFVPSPDEISRRAYFSYVNQGTPQGCDVQHWLAAEEELIAERNRTRVHGYHNRN